MKDYAFLAEMFVRAGAHWIGLDFDGVEETEGNLLPMAEQVRRAVAWVYKNAKSFGGDAERSTSRASRPARHLGGIVRDHRLGEGVSACPKNVVKGALLCSGMYDLKPVRLSKRSQYVTFTDEMEEKLSSQRHLDKLNCPVIVALRHLRDARVPAAGRATSPPRSRPPASRSRSWSPKASNHFEMLETLANPL